MKELVVVIEVTNILVSVGSDSFVGWDPGSDGKVFVKCIGSPVLWKIAGNNGLQAASLVSGGFLNSGPIQKSSGEVEV